MTTVERTRRPLITDEPWDAYRLESLLPLKETYRENTEFGFLLRHYWMPATMLQFRQSSRTTLPNGTVEHSDLEIERKMARCRSNECLWRETIRPVAGTNGDRPILSEMLCSYDCYEQTFHSAKPILFGPLAPDQKLEARRQALYRLPMLCPPGPTPLGSCWYGSAGDDYMNYRLDAVERIGDTSVLVIRREGRFTIWRPAEPDMPEGETKPVPMVIARQGVTIYATHRCAVLEDRTMDRVIAASEPLESLVGTTTQTVVRLVRSVPVEEPSVAVAGSTCTVSGSSATDELPVRSSQA